jgi:hypothetical protein
MEYIVDDKFIFDLLHKDFFEILGLENVPEETKEKIMEEVGKTLEFKVLNRIWDILEEKDKALLEEWKSLMDSQDFEGIKNFLEREKIDLYELFLEEAISLKAYLLTASKQTK